MSTSPEPPRINRHRRSLIKATGALAAGGVIWSEPTLNGLARRPAYAAAASTITTGALSFGTYSFNDDGSNFYFEEIASDGAVSFQLTADSPTSYQLRPFAFGCNCVFDTVDGIVLGDGVTSVAGTSDPAFPGAITFVWDRSAGLANQIEAFIEINYTCTPI